MLGCTAFLSLDCFRLLRTQNVYKWARAFSSSNDDIFTRTRQFSFASGAKAPTFS
jgi:hypothetical protein